MKESIIENLVDIGLTQNEAEIYYCLLKSGSSTILNLAKLTDIKRPTVYNIISALESNGLVSLQSKGNKKYYVPESPERLQQILVSKAALLKGIMPDLAKQYFQVKKQDNIIKHYVGIDSIKTMYRDLVSDLKENSDYYVMSDQIKWRDLDPDFFGAYIQNRHDKGIKAKYLVSQSDFAKEFQKSIEFDEVKLLPKEVKLDTDMVIVPGKQVMIMQIVPPYIAFLIDNTAITNMNQMLFETLWNSIE